MFASLRWTAGLFALLLLVACTRERPTPEPTATLAQALSGAATPTAAQILEPQVTSTTPQAVVQAEGTPSPEASPSTSPTPEETFQYTVQPGDTLSAIAIKFETDVETLRELNQLRDGDNLLVGLPLYVPYREGMTAEGMPTPTPGPFLYTIQPGDTLSAIATRFGVDQIAVIETNGILAPNNLTVGAQIVIPGYQPEAGEAAAGTGQAPVGADAGDQASANGFVTHIVQPGEGLYEIAEIYGVDAADIAAVNNVTNRNMLRVGQELVIPGVSPQDALTARGAVHVVQSGESLLGIAVRYGVTVEEILEVNEIDDPDSIYVGQELIIPGS